MIGWVAVRFEIARVRVMGRRFAADPGKETSRCVPLI